MAAVTVMTNEKVASIINSDHFFYLFQRWVDESEYEDINDYGANIAKEFGVQIISSKRSFRFTIELEDKSRWEIGVRSKGQGSYVGVYREVVS